MQPAEPCPHCELSYTDLRTGFSYQDVYEMLWSGSDDPRTWVHKGRRQVLGKWHEIKLGQWADHCAECEHYYCDRRRCALASCERFGLPVPSYLGATMLKSRIAEVAADCGVTEAEILAGLADGSWFVCGLCGYPTHRTNGQDVAGEGLLCDECESDYWDSDDNSVFADTPF